MNGWGLRTLSHYLSFVSLMLVTRCWFCNADVVHYLDFAMLMVSWLHLVNADRFLLMLSCFSESVLQHFLLFFSQVEHIYTLLSVINELCLLHHIQFNGRLPVHLGTPFCTPLSHWAVIFALLDPLLTLTSLAILINMVFSPTELPLTWYFFFIRPNCLDTSACEKTTKHRYLLYAKISGRIFQTQRPQNINIQCM